MGCSVQGRPKKVTQVKIKVKSMLTTSFDINGIVHKASALAIQVDKSEYYSDCYGYGLKMHEDFTPKIS
jgi:hypothetical protein